MLFDVVLTLLMLLLLIKLLPLQYKVTHQRYVTNKDITNSVSDTIGATYREFILIHLKWEI